MKSPKNLFTVTSHNHKILKNNYFFSSKTRYYWELCVVIGRNEKYIEEIHFTQWRFKWIFPWRNLEGMILTRSFNSKTAHGSATDFRFQKLIKINNHKLYVRTILKFVLAKLSLRSKSTDKKKNCLPTAEEKLITWWRR